MKYKRYKNPERKEVSYTQSYGNPSVENFKTIIVYGTLGIATIGGLAFLGNYLLKKSAKRKSDNRSLTEGDPASYARELIMAFQNDNWLGWGTNVELVYNVFDRIPSQNFYKKVQTAYQNETKGKNLNADLADELTIEEYGEVKRRLNSKS